MPPSWAHLPSPPPVSYLDHPLPNPTGALPLNLSLSSPPAAQQLDTEVQAQDAPGASSEVGRWAGVGPGEVGEDWGWGRDWGAGAREDGLRGEPGASAGRVRVGANGASNGMRLDGREEGSAKKDSNFADPPHAKPLPPTPSGASLCAEMRGGFRPASGALLVHKRCGGGVERR